MRSACTRAFMKQSKAFIQPIRCTQQTSGEAQHMECLTHKPACT